MCNSSEIHYLLHAVFSKHCNTRLTGSHNILMVAENVQRGCSKRTRTDMEHARQKLAGNLIHVRNHEHHALGCRIGCCKRACLQGAVYSTCRAAL